MLNVGEVFKAFSPDIDKVNKSNELVISKTLLKIKEDLIELSADRSKEMYKNVYGSLIHNSPDSNHSPNSINSRMAE